MKPKKFDPMNEMMKLNRKAAKRFIKSFPKKQLKSLWCTLKEEKSKLLE